MAEVADLQGVEFHPGPEHRRAEVPDVFDHLDAFDRAVAVDAGLKSQSARVTWPETVIPAIRVVSFSWQVMVIFVLLVRHRDRVSEGRVQRHIRRRVVCPAPSSENLVAVSPPMR